MTMTQEWEHVQFYERAHNTVMTQHIVNLCILVLVICAAQVYVANCDSGVDSATIAALPPSLQPYAMSLQSLPIGNRLLDESILNPNSAASKALKWREYTCAQGVLGINLFDKALSIT